MQSYKSHQYCQGDSNIRDLFDPVLKSSVVNNTASFFGITYDKFLSNERIAIADSLIKAQNFNALPDDVRNLAACDTEFNNIVRDYGILKH